MQGVPPSSLVITANIGPPCFFCLSFSIILFYLPSHQSDTDWSSPAATRQRQQQAKQVWTITAGHTPQLSLTSKQTSSSTSYSHSHITTGSTSDQQQPAGSWTLPRTSSPVVSASSANHRDPERIPHQFHHGTPLSLQVQVLCQQTHGKSALFHPQSHGYIHHALPNAP